MRILGIDPGSRSIKAVEIDSAFGRYEIHEYHERVLQSGEDANQAITALISSLSRKPDRIVTAMPSRKVTFRNLRLPTRDKKSVHAAVGFELEDELPFPADQCVYDYSVLSQNKQGSHVHVAASLEKYLQDELERWTLCGIDPDAITTEAWAYRTFLNRVLSPELQDHPALLVHLGHERTLFYGHWKGIPILSREIGVGGRDLTLGIGQKLGLPVTTAEKTKHDRGFTQPEIAEAMSEAMGGFLLDLKQAELGCKSITQERPSTIYLSGIASLTPGLASWLEAHLKVPVKLIQGLSAVATSGVTYSEKADASFLLAVGSALTQVGQDRSTAINFRKGFFAKKTKSKEVNWTNLKRPLLGAAIVAMGFFVSLIAQSFVYQSRLQETHTQLERAVRNFFGGQISSGAVKTYLSNTAKLKAQVTKELARNKELARLFEPNQKSALEFLRELSATFPRDVVVDLIEYQVGASAQTVPFNKVPEESTAALTFLVADPQSVERTGQLLSSKLLNISRSKTEEVSAPDGSGKRLKITFTGKPSETSYGH